MSNDSSSRSVRQREYLVRAAILIVLSVPACYLSARWSGRRELAAAKAEWNAADTPFKFGDKLKGSQPLPPGENLLEADFFSEWRSKNGGAKPDPKFEKWGEALRVKSTLLRYDGSADDFAGVFSASGKTPPLLSESPGKSQAEVLAATLETEFPALADLPAMRRDHPGFSLGFTYPPLADAFSADTVSFKRCRNSHAILLAYATAQIQTGRPEPARCALEASIGHIRLLQGEPTLVQPLIGAVLAKAMPHTLHCALEHSAFRRPVVGRARRGVGENPHRYRRAHRLRRRGHVWPAVAEKNGFLFNTHSGVSSSDILDAMLTSDFWKNDAASFLGLLAAPEGWATSAHADSIRIHLALQTKGFSATGELNLGEINKTAGAIDAIPRRPWTELAASGFPNPRKMLLNAAATDTAVRCARLAIALERHRVRRGSFPENLPDLMWPCFRTAKSPSASSLGNRLRTP